MPKPDNSIDITPDGELIVVTRVNKGHISQVDPMDVPAECWEDFDAELEAYHDGQRAAAGVQEAACDAYTRAVEGWLRV